MVNGEHIKRVVGNNEGRRARRGIITDQKNRNKHKTKKNAPINDKTTEEGSGREKSQ